MRGNQLVPELLLKQSDTLLTKYSFVNLSHFFLLTRGYACAQIVHTRRNQCVPELLLKLLFFAHTIQIMNMCMRKCHAKKKFFFFFFCRVTAYQT